MNDLTNLARRMLLPLALVTAGLPLTIGTVALHPSRESTASLHLSPPGYCYTYSLKWSSPPPLCSASFAPLPIEANGGNYPGFDVTPGTTYKMSLFFYLQCNGNVPPDPAFGINNYITVPLGPWEVKLWDAPTSELSATHSAISASGGVPGGKLLANFGSMVGANDGGAREVASFTFPQAPANYTPVLVWTGSRSHCGLAQVSAVETAAVGTTLGIDWEMRPRLTKEVEEYEAREPYGLPPTSYVNPPNWKLRLFVTIGGKPACPDDLSFQWTIAGEGFSQQLPSSGCSVVAAVPKLGVYDVRATEFKDGVPTGKVIENKQVIVRDWLILGMGDSNGSGEGNGPPWIFAQCDRSLASYQYQTAQYIQDRDPHSSVTFIFTSCSGARIEHLDESFFLGTHPNPASQLPPQIDQIKALIGNRKIDAVILSVGINNLYFGPLMTFCIEQNIIAPLSPCENAHVIETKDPKTGDITYSSSKNASDPTLAQDTEAAVQSLSTEYAKLNAYLKAILNPAHVFITQYPDIDTDQTGGLCQYYEGPPPRYDESTWAWFEKTTLELNQAVLRTGADEGWIPITGIPDGFIGHGYCSSDSYFVPLNHALAVSNPPGAFHPNKDGQGVTFNATRPVVCQTLYGNLDCNGIPPWSGG